MIRTILLLLALGGLAVAAPRTDAVVAPAGWAADPEQAVKARTIAGKPAAVAVDVFRAPGGGAVLYATRIVADVPADQRDAIASAELAELADAMRRQGANVKAESAAQKADPVIKQLEAAVRWRDDSAGLIASSRMLIAAESARLVIVTGECMLATDASPAHSTACEAALATLRTNVAPDQRVPLAIVAAPAPEPARTIPEPAKFDDGSKAVLPAVTVTQTRRETDRRPIYVGFGIVVLAAVFYWNRRRRERFERDDADPPAPAEPASEPVASGGDEDADDLHAAAAREEDKS